MNPLSSTCFEIVTECPLCNIEDNDQIFSDIKDRFYGLAGSFGIVQCRKCTLIRLSPRPKAEFAQYYYPEDSYYSFQENQSAISSIVSKGTFSKLRDSVRNETFATLGYPTEPSAGLSRVFARTISLFFFDKATYGWGKRFPRYLSGGSALDIGCGTGTFLSYLKHYGWQVQGLELSPKSAIVARDRHGIDVFVGELKDAPFEPESFDLITLFHSLEHVYDPISTLQRVHELLKPDGCLYIEVPNIASFGIQIDREHWFHWDPPRHIWGFNSTTLENLLSKAAFSIEKLTSLHAPSHDWAETYRFEEESGHLLGQRPKALTGLKRLSEVYRRTLSGLVYRLRPMSGNYLCCWAKKT